MGQYNITSVFLWFAVMMFSLKLGETMEDNEFLLSKWRTHIEIFDPDKDGVVRYEDMEKARRKFFIRCTLSGEERKQAKAQFTNWWVGDIMWGGDEITVDEYIARNNAAYEADRFTFIDRIQRGETRAFHVFDSSDDGFISEEEAISILSALGHENVDLMKECFQKHHPIDNKVPVVYMIYYWTHYFITEDDTADDIAVGAMENGL